MTVLNLSRFYEEPEYEDWLYDFLEDMPDSLIKRFMLAILEEPDDSQDLNDSTFSAFYENPDAITAEQEELKKIWLQGEKS